MAKPILPEDYQDDIPAAEMNGKRRYVLTENSDGTYCLEDVTRYAQLGSRFGAGQINNISKAVNQSADQAVIIDDIEDIRANTTEKKIAGALALKQVDGNIDGCRVTTEGSGADTKYFIQKGADAASKKQLGSGEIQRTAIASGVGNGTYSAKAVKDYNKLTVQNFAYVVTSIAGRSSHADNASRLGYDPPVNANPSISYDAASGNVNVYGCSNTARQEYGGGHETRSVSASGILYCFHPA